MNKKVSELPSASDADNTDLLLIVDVSTGTTKKITRSALLAGFSGTGHVTELYDTDGNLVLSTVGGVLTSSGNVNFSNGDVIGDLTFSSGAIQGNVNVDIQGYLITSGNMDIGGQGEIHGNTYFDGDLYSGIDLWSILTDGTAQFCLGGNPITFGTSAIGTVYSIPLAHEFHGNTYFGDRVILDYGAWVSDIFKHWDDAWVLNDDGGATFANANVQFSPNILFTTSGLDIFNAFYGNTYFSDKVRFDGGILVHGDSEFFDYLSAWVIQGGNGGTDPVWFGPDSSAQINADGSASFAGGAATISSDGIYNLSNVQLSDDGLHIGSGFGEEFAYNRDGIMLSWTENEHSWTPGGITIKGGDIQLIAGNGSDHGGQIHLSNSDVDITTPNTLWMNSTGLWFTNYAGAVNQVAMVP